MKIQDLLYRQSLLEEFLEPGSTLEIPGKGFHTLYEREIQLDDRTWALVAYVEGGANCGVRYTIVIHRDRDCAERDTCGWSAGFRLPVAMRPLSSLSVKDFRGLTPQKLLVLEEVPGFVRFQSGTYRQGWHSQDWYSQSLFVREITPGAVLTPGARVFLLREGVYIYFPDASIRLMTYADYFKLPEEAPDFRQGDLLVWKQERDIRGDEYVSSPEDVRLAKIGQHQIIVLGNEFHSVTKRDWMQGGWIEHPNHEPLILRPDDSGPDVAAKGYSWQYLPGSGTPFSKRRK